jgi:phage/plasmid-associated DNA primase
MFAEYAPFYWAKGLPAMPLRPRSKIPALMSWQHFAKKMPNADEQAAWLAAYPDGNMGLPLGEQSRIVVIDLDTDDPKVLRILESLMPPTPWVRRGKKGAVYAFRFNGERSFRIKDEDGASILEVLSSGTQVVLPPSIHPDTQLPYEANAPLYEVLDRLNPLPANFEGAVRKALIDEGYKLTTRGQTKLIEWVPAGGRDSALVSVAGLTARDILSGRISLLEGLNQIATWVSAFTERVIGDSMSAAKAQEKVLEFLRRDVVEHKKMLPPGWDAGMDPSEVIRLRTYFGEDVEEWDQARLLDYLTQKFIEIPREDILGRTKIIDETVIRIARSTALTSIDEDVIVRFIVSANNRLITAESLRKELKKLRAGEMQGNDHTEIATALLERLEAYGEIRFYGTTFYQWRGSHWQELPETRLFDELAKEFGKLPAARRHADHKGIIAVVRTLASKPLVELSVPGVNFANGYLTLDLELRPHEPKYGATYVLPYRYMPECGTPLRFLSFLDQCWGEDPDYPEKVQAVREAVAVTLFGLAARFSRAICLYGVPNSGKSTLSKIVLGLVPESAACSVPPHDWGDKFLPSQMAGKLVNFCGELSESAMISGSAFKSIVEGEEMNGQHKGKDIFKFRPLCAHWFASNHLPRTRDTSAGFNRRWLFLHFTRAISQAIKVLGLENDILAEEREMIASWAVGVLPELLQRQEYTLPRSHWELVSEVAASNNSIRFFLLSGAVEVRAAPEDGGSSIRTSERDLYGRYYAFCKTLANVPPVALKRFRLMAQELQSELGFNIRVTTGNCGEECHYENLMLVTAAKRAS